MSCRQAALRSHSTPWSEQLRRELPLFSWISLGVRRLRLIGSRNGNNRSAIAYTDTALRYPRTFYRTVAPFFFFFVTCGSVPVVLVQ